MNPQQTLNPGCSMMVNNIGEERLLLSHLQPHMRVLEFGFGLSTNIIARLVRQVVTVEYNADWYAYFKPTAAANVTALLVPANQPPSPAYDDGTFADFQAYVLAPMPYASAEKFDVVLIDGRARVACAEYAAKHYLKDGGLIFIHDYKHPQQQYRRMEYEPVEQFLDLKKHVFAMACFTKKGQSSKYLDITGGAPSNVADIPDLDKNAAVPTVFFMTEKMKETNIADIPAIEKTAETITVNPAPDTAHPAPDKSTCWYSGDTVVNEMNKFFDGYIKNHEIKKHMEPFSTLLSIIEAGENKALLDLGCGTAMLTEFCKEFNYMGADLPHIIVGCAMRNYPNYAYRACDMEADDLSWISQFDVVVLNGVIDIMQYPVQMLLKVLAASKKYVLIHRQEITEAGQTEVHKGPGYGNFAWHSKISRADFEKTVADAGYKIVAETPCFFTNWENGGSSFLLMKN